MMRQLEIKKIIRQLKKKNISIFDIPEEYKNESQIVTFERKKGLRITGKRGFDIISNTFFVEETLIEIDPDYGEEKKEVFLSFDDFDSYYDFLNGNIYDNACYMFCPSSRIITSKKIDIKELMSRKSFTKNTIDDCTLSLSQEEKEKYKKERKKHKYCKQWINKFNNCTNYDDLDKLVNNYNKSKMHSFVDISFFFFQYIFSDVKDKNRLFILMKHLSFRPIFNNNMIKALCSIHNPDDILKLINFFSISKTKSYSYNEYLKEYIRLLKEGEIVFYNEAFFDKNSHYYCEKSKGYLKDNIVEPITTIYRCFETFDEFINYRKGDLRNCDLSALFEGNMDFSQYIVDETTTLPIFTNSDITYSVKKYYENEIFYVTQNWLNKSGNTLKEYKHSFKYFFDFVSFLKGNLSDADLLLCDGLNNLVQWDFIDFTNAKIKSSLCEKFGLQYDSYELNPNVIGSFECVEKNEAETALVLQTSRDLSFEMIGQGLSYTNSNPIKCPRVHYISDIHLMHRIQNAGCRSKEDVIYTIQKIVNTIANEAENLLLIGGDVSSDIRIFQLFVKMLSKALYPSTKVVFILGNHELWSFPGYQIEQIVSEYRTILENHGMYLLHNDILYMEDYGLKTNPNKKFRIIKYHDLFQMNDTQIADRLRTARYVILGGLGFSGYNTEFNADNGVYRMTVDRTTEIQESIKFEDLYNRLYPILSDKNVIILTHTPKKDWCKEESPDKNYVYVSGHTHRNNFTDDGEYRIYSDNQVGYHNENLQLKTFLIDSDYDCFFDYEDGIFEITSEQYKDFYRGKNIPMTFQQEANTIYMLKKNKYYFFIHKSKNGSLTILNGGAKRKLEKQDVQYYYDNMDTMISTIKTPLDKYTSFQKQISNFIKQIGGNGTIHGSIIDIDFNNHIYVNPFDLSITGYFAFDITDKYVYPSIPTLLEDNCPTLYNNYTKLLTGDSENPLALKQEANIKASPEIYLETDIYKASREIKKMQKLNSNILTSWYEDALHKSTKIELIDK